MIGVLVALDLSSYAMDSSTMNNVTCHIENLCKIIYICITIFINMIQTLDQVLLEK